MDNHAKGKEIKGREALGQSKVSVQKKVLKIYTLNDLVSYNIC